MMTVSSTDPPAVRLFPEESQLRALLSQRFPAPLRMTCYFDEAVAGALQERDRFSASRLPLPELIRRHVDDEITRFLNDVSQIVQELLASDPVRGIDGMTAAHETAVALFLSGQVFDPTRHTSVRAWIRGFARNVLDQFRRNSEVGGSLAGVRAGRCPSARRRSHRVPAPARRAEGSRGRGLFDDCFPGGRPRPAPRHTAEAPCQPPDLEFSLDS
jgi:hypothetical protein